MSAASVAQDIEIARAAYPIATEEALKIVDEGKRRAKIAEYAADARRLGWAIGASGRPERISRAIVARAT